MKHNDRRVHAHSPLQEIYFDEEVARQIAYLDRGLDPKPKARLAPRSEHSDKGELVFWGFAAVAITAVATAYFFGWLITEALR